MKRNIREERIGGYKMKKVVFITGSSSGIGLETAKYFHEKGWQVIASMRNPDKRNTVLHEIEGIELLHLDVLDQDSAEKAVESVIKKYGKIDALINNAGYELLGPIETLTDEQIKKQFDTNIVAVVSLSKLIIPHMRKAKGGHIINIASIGGQMVFPCMSIYHSTKYAVEGFSKGLSYELREFNIKVKIIEPGLIATNFYSTSLQTPRNGGDNPYQKMTDKVIKNAIKFGQNGSHPSVVAKTIYKAANSQNNKMHYATGQYARTLLLFSRWMPSLFQKTALHMMTK